VQTILLVEDQPEIRDIMGLLLTLSGYNVILASNGKEGLNLATSLPFDLVITDIKMPQMDGNSLISELARFKNPPPVIALAGSVNDIIPNSIIRAIACKPITTQQLRQLIARALV
jgi:two-component system cell cycle sensor histidine kinase/response regulator CckA